MFACDALSPLQITVEVNSGVVLAISTARTVYSLGATACSQAHDDAALSSLNNGSFTPDVNSQGNTVGWVWDTGVELAASQNHWYRHTSCDGAVEVRGCDAEIPVTATTTAYDSHGDCRTYVDGAGFTVCVSSTGTAALSAVQDADVVEVCAAADGCGIGECVSACQAECGGAPEDQQDGRQACRNACECQCKISVRSGNPQCSVEAKCLE